MKPLAAAFACLLMTCGCNLGGVPKDQTFSTDKTVDQATADRFGEYLLRQVPAIAATREQLQTQAGRKLQQIIRVEHAPEPGYQGPDTPYHRDYYWMYVGFHNRDGIVKSFRYLIRKDQGDILVYDEATDAFVKP